jgi:pimeloyl-ACP methyl ester carboxylesterase
MQQPSTLLDHPEPPSTKRLLMEFPIASKELMSLGNKRWKKLLQDAPAGDGHSVMTIPGFGGGDGSMAFLRRYLARLGYRSEPWELGTNMPKGRVTMMDDIMEFCEQMEADIAKRAEVLAEQTRDKVSLIGWSLGGIYANSLAQTRPDIIRQVITLGSPLGDPRGTSTWNILKRMNRSDVPEDMQDVSPWLRRRDQQGERKVHTTILYSETDGAVSKESAMIRDHHLVENIKVASSHIGFAHNPLVYWIIADRLSQHPVNWKPFEIDNQPLMIRKKLK